MALNQELLKELCEKLERSKRRVYGKIKEIADTQLVSNEYAAYILAYKEGIRLKKYLNSEELKDMRGSILDVKTAEPLKKDTKANTTIATSLNIYLDKKFQEIKEPLLPNKIFSDAKKMALYYPYFYILENSIRNLMMIVMEKKYGINWWEDEIEKNSNFIQLCQELNGRKETEKEFRWHGTRKAHEIFYVDINDLRKIIKDYWPSSKANFKSILKRISWVDNMLQTINMSRRIIAHNNPLSQRDFQRVKLHLKDWCDQMKLAKDKL